MRKLFQGGMAIAILFNVLIIFCNGSYAENIDPENDGSKYAYAENVGWLNAKPLTGSDTGVEVENTRLTGHIWTENIGWVSLACENTKSCSKLAYGVTNDGSGILAGYGWSENAGWISFSCENSNSCDFADYGVTIDQSTGEFAGYAWGENIGWISFRSTGPVKYRVITSWVASSDKCECDFEPDGDVDGDDLAAYLEDDRGIALKSLTDDYGRIDCN